MSQLSSHLDRLMRVGGHFLTGFELNKPVGDWRAKAVNIPEDVEAVQLLLEYAASVSKCQEVDPGGVDGKISRTTGRSGTVRAIRAFQKTLMSKPDGRVDPNGATHNKLREQVTGASFVASAKASMSSINLSDGMPSWLRSVNVFSASAAPDWLDIAEDELGEAEIPGRAKNARIGEYHATVLGKVRDEDDPWCASFVNWVLEKAGYTGADSAWSHHWKNWGDGISKPAVGAVAFIDWGKVYPNKPKKQGRGHVGFVVGQTPNGRIVLLGGNQSNAVKYAQFGRAKIAAYRVPKGYEVDPSLYALPTLNVDKGAGGFNATR
ncbi:TIGR02594 family protein [Thalassotalea euphylliae]|uniref:TIGR02594 family protein n=1 Tax=Thalassotalea euphylliae TaxID=1655234 RepID=A0A3E0TSW9_9GAMM|nr:TIGR02594 family protein [Thalassotalea euphylliae]REL27746.1 TIGR02594 family protein [Thalassotalea euphylliae]